MLNKAWGWIVTEIGVVDEELLVTCAGASGRARCK